MTIGKNGFLGSSFINEWVVFGYAPIIMKTIDLSIVSCNVLGVHISRSTVTNGKVEVTVVIKFDSGSKMLSTRTIVISFIQRFYVDESIVF